MSGACSAAVLAFALKVVELRAQVGNAHVALHVFTRYIHVALQVPVDFRRPHEVMMAGKPLA